MPDAVPGWDGHEWVTSMQAASYLQVHPRTIQRYARSGVIDAARVGGRLRFRRVDVEAFLHAQTNREEETE